MRTQDERIDARRDVLERRVLAQGETAEQWAVEVAQPVANVWTTTFYVGVQSFRLAEAEDSAEAEQHCMFIGRMFVAALHALLNVETRTLRQVIVTTNDLLFDSRIDDPQHQVDCHADTLPEVFLKLSAGHDAAFETLQTVIREWVDPDLPPIKHLDPPEDIGGGVRKVAEIDDGTGASEYECVGSGSEPSSVLGGEVVARSSMDTGREARGATSARGSLGGTLAGSGRRTEAVEGMRVAEKEKIAERFRTGNYRHYKGGTYTALGLVSHHDSRAPMVLYVSHSTGEPAVRPLKPAPNDPDAWNDWVEREGKRVRRFSYLGPGASSKQPNRESP